MNSYRDIDPNYDPIPDWRIDEPCDCCNYCSCADQSSNTDPALMRELDALTRKIWAEAAKNGKTSKGAA